MKNLLSLKEFNNHLDLASNTQKLYRNKEKRASIHAVNTMNSVFVHQFK